MGTFIIFAAERKNSIKMNQQVTEIARGITDYGLTAMIGAFYLIITALMMITLFKWFKGIINQILEDNKDSMRELLEETRKQNDMLYDLSDGLKAETQMRLRNISSFAFDLSISLVCGIIRQVRKENHIIDHPATTAKIRGLISNIHEDRKSRFDPFTYRGKSISAYCNPEWIDLVCEVVESEIYNEQGADDDRAHTNVKMVYGKIKLDFYHRLNA